MTAWPSSPRGCGDDGQAVLRSGPALDGGPDVVEEVAQLAAEESDGHRDHDRDEGDKERVLGSRCAAFLLVSVSQYGARAMSAGAKVFLQKPLDAAGLLRNLRELTSRQLGGRVLLIDDNEVSRYVLRNVLPEESVEIVEARSGREGLQAAVQQQPKVIFLDLVMPDLNGFEVLRELRQNARTRDIPVVIHSSHPINESEKERIDYPRVMVWPKNQVERDDAAAEMLKLLALLGIELHPAREGRHA